MSTRPTDGGGEDDGLVGRVADRVKEGLAAVDRALMALPLPPNEPYHPADGVLHVVDDIDFEEARRTREEAARVARRTLPGTVAEGLGVALEFYGLVDDRPEVSRVDPERAAEAAGDLRDLIDEFEAGGERSRRLARRFDAEDRLPERPRGSDHTPGPIPRNPKVDLAEVERGERESDGEVNQALTDGIGYLDDLAEARRAELRVVADAAGERFAASSAREDRKLDELEVEEGRDGESTAPDRLTVDRPSEFDDAKDPEGHTSEQTTDDGHTEGF